METFGQRLRSLRRPEELEAVAKIMKVAPQTLGNYERGRNQPKFDSIWEVCSHFGICPEWLIFGTGPKYRKEDANLHPYTQKSGICPTCAAYERILEKERQERQALAAENRYLNFEMGKLMAQVEAREKGGEGQENDSEAKSA